MRATPSTHNPSRLIGALATLLLTAITSSASAAATPVGPFDLNVNDREAVERANELMRELNAAG